MSDLDRPRGPGKFSSGLSHVLALRFVCVCACADFVFDVCVWIWCWVRVCVWTRYERNCGSARTFTRKSLLRRSSSERQKSVTTWYVCLCKEVSVSVCKECGGYAHQTHNPHTHTKHKILSHTKHEILTHTEHNIHTRTQRHQTQKSFTFTHIHAHTHQTQRYTDMCTKNCDTLQITINHEISRFQFSTRWVC